MHFNNNFSRELDVLWRNCYTLDGAQIGILEKSNQVSLGWMSFGVIVTRLVWMAHKLVSSKSPTK